MYLTFHYGPYSYSRVHSTVIGISDEDAKSLLIASPLTEWRLAFVRNIMHARSVALEQMFNDDKVTKGRC